MQYIGELSIGGQQVKGVMDTGSFELVLFSHWCATCGTGRRYNERASHTFSMGGAHEEQNYGSGACQTIDGFDKVASNGLVAQRQAFWLGTECDIPAIMNQPISGIIGIGPPGEPVSRARKSLEDLQRLKAEYQSIGAAFPDDMEDRLAKAKNYLELASGRTSMLENFGVRSFSFCVEQQSGGPGWVVWNDQPREPGARRIPVLAGLDWAISVKAVGFSHNGKTIPMVCQSGCNGVLDTGTSFFGVTSSMFQTIFSTFSSLLQRVPAQAQDCTDLSHFPELVMEIGGQQLRFPPSSYLGVYLGNMKNLAGGFVHTSTFTQTRCSLLFIDTGHPAESPHGPEFLLGIPFFREYFTTLHLGGHRSISVSKAKTADCAPDASQAVNEKSRRNDLAYMYTPRQVDVSMIRLPTRLKRPRGNFSESA